MHSYLLCSSYPYVVRRNSSSNKTTQERELKHAQAQNQLPLSQKNVQQSQYADTPIVRL